MSVRDCKFVNFGRIFIMQLNRYTNSGGHLLKDNRIVKCPSELLNISVSVDENLSVTRKFKLRATINHSGTISAGHYWAFIKESSNNQWLKCNDTTVTKATFKDVSNNTSYIFIYSDN